MQLPYEKMLEIWVAQSGISEAEFWQMTLAEYVRWLRPFLSQNTRFSRQTLEELMKQFPDG